MIKRLLTDNEYTIINTTTILIDSSVEFEAKNLNLILDTTDNRIVYNFACEDKRASISGQTITLLDETVELTDSLTIIMSFDEGSEIEKLENLIVWNSRIESLLEESLEEQRITNKYLKKIYNPE
jgi:hypothetical protein